MNLEMFNNQLLKSENKINELKNKLGESQNLIVCQFKNYTAEYFKKEIEDKVKLNSENTKNLGLEKLSELKKELNELINQSSELVEKYINIEEVWGHIDYKVVLENEFNQRFNIKSDTNSRIQSVFRLLIGHLGQLLIKYQYVKYGSEGWEKDYNSNLPKYKYGLGLPKNIQESIASYIKLFEELHDELVQYKKIEKNKNQFEATSLWEQA